MEKIGYVAILLILFSCADSILSDSDESKEDPNILFIFVDDMGYGDLSAYSENGISTPHIDRLADEGIRFTQFYVNSPICSPSRVAVTTGQYPLRWDITSFLARRELNDQRNMAHYLDPNAPSLARMLKGAGYYTAHIGKWHMGGQRNVPGPLISEYGFEESLTQFEGLGDRLGLIFETREWNCCGHRFPLSVGQADLEPGEVHWVNRYKEPEHFVDSTLREIDKAESRDQPFYINLWTDAVHTPLEAPPSRRGDGSVEAHYEGVIKELDQQLGRIIDRIREDSDLRNNTFVVFASDNGPSNRIGSTSPFRGHKGNLFEGGIRTPFIVWAPGIIEEDKTGSANEQTVLAGMDLPPSLLSIAGVDKPEGVQFDGLDMSEVLLGESERKREEPVMWLRPPGTDDNQPDLAIREGKWKLLVNKDGSYKKLYNLETNQTESINYAEEFPDTTARLEEKVMNWYEELSQ